MDYLHQNMMTSISKAINNQETPVKEKHVRSTIIGSYHEKGASTFWAVVGVLPIQGNPIVCWKFCHTLHKLLREGHPNVIPESKDFRGRLLELGRYWGHLKDTYGKLISSYCRLLATKLEFHYKNPKFPGNLQLTDEQLESIGEMDINNFFQITVEMFDYMDEILNLQAAVFNSQKPGNSNSMTSSGQCRLAPLIPCIQDSSHLYDYLVKLLFKLHSSLPPDILVGHRDRFYKEFKVLRDFYSHSSTLQYFRHLIQIPLLPEDPPNFLIKCGINSHISPVVILPPQEDLGDTDSVDMSLVDTSSPTPYEMRPTNGSTSPDLLYEKDQIIENLRREIEDLRREIQVIREEDQRIIGEFQKQSASLESYIQDLQEQVSQKQKEMDTLKLTAVETTEAKEKLDEVEKKYKATEGKFQKMKEMYNKIRVEHIALIRSKAEVEKQLGSVKQASSDTARTKSHLEDQVQRLITEKEAAERQAHQNAIKATEQMASWLQSKETLEKEKLALTEKLTLVTNEKSNLEQSLRQSLDSTKEELMQLRESRDQLDGENKEFDELLFKAIDEKYVAEQSMSDKVEEYEQRISKLNEEKGELQVKVAELEASVANVTYEKCTSELTFMQNSETLNEKINELSQQKRDVESLTRDLEEQLNEMRDDRVSLQQQVADLQEQMATLETETQESKQESEELQRKTVQESLDRQFTLLVGCLEEAEAVLQNTLDEIKEPIVTPVSSSLEFLLHTVEPLAHLLDRLEQQNNSYTRNFKDVEHLLRSVARLSHQLAKATLMGKAAANILPDIEQGDKLTDMCQTCGNDGLQLFSSMKAKDSGMLVAPSIEKLRTDVETLKKLVQSLVSARVINVSEQIGDLVEKEMSDMESAIEEAASRIAEILNKTRKADSGVKLEVSEKILDACTALMQSIRILVKRSKDMQQEIVNQGKGSASVKEFYKRNNQWTEGLLSAAKAVGIGAKFLVDAADKVVDGKAKFETLMAASQEIAASVAQLVVASKVKAPPSSSNLLQLSKASIDVRGCTGTVVATVKDCAQMMEDSEVMNFDNLTLHQAKRLEMESQVRVLELENGLEKERVKLSALRKKHYTMAGPGEGWEE